MFQCQLKLCGCVKAHVIDFPEFNDPGWLCDLAFLMDIMSHLNNLNVQLQGKDILMPDMVSHITAFEVKLRLWESQLMKSDFMHFKHLHVCSPEDISVHVGIVTQLQEESSASFSDLWGYKYNFKLFTSPFDVYVESAPSEVQMELIDLQCSDELKSRFAAVGHADFWRKHIFLNKCFPGLVDNEMRTVAAFSCTYCCEQLFSRMKLTKSKSRAQLTDGHLNDVLLLSVSSVASDISSVSAQKQHQVSH